MRADELITQNIGKTLTPALAVAIDQAIRKLIAPKKEFEWADPTPVTWRGYTFQVEHFPEVQADLEALHKEHWLETEGYRSGVPMDPNYKAFAYYDGMGIYRLFTIRRDGVLIGDCGMYMARAVHTQQIVSKEDTIFITAGERKGWLAAAFLRYMEKVLVKECKVTEIDCTVKEAVNSEPLLRRIGYRKSATVMTKVYPENVR